MDSGDELAVRLVIVNDLHSRFFRASSSAIRTGRIDAQTHADVPDCQAFGICRATGIFGHFQHMNTDRPALTIDMQAFSHFHIAED